MAPDEGVLQGRDQPRAAARLSNPREDCIRAHINVSPTTTPGREYLHIYRAFPIGGLRNYARKYRVGSSDIEDQTLLSSLQDEGGTPTGMAEGHNHLGCLI